MSSDAPPAYTEATRDGPPAYETLFPVKAIKEAKENSSNKGTFAAKLCEIICGSFACLCCLVIMAALPLAMVVIGGLHVGNCEGQRFIPIWLIVFGSVSLLHTIVSSLKYCAKIGAKKTEEDGENRNKNLASRGGSGCESLLSVFLFIWTIVGSSWVFTYYYSTWVPNDCINNYDRQKCQCEAVPFLFSYITLIIMYALSLLICCCGCFCIVSLGLIAGVTTTTEE